MSTRDKIEKTGIKARDKAVCVDDTHWRCNLAERPNGFHDTGDNVGYSDSFIPETSNP
jgi:hypothetical protein